MKPISYTFGVRLTRREKEISALIIIGLTTRRIASLLSISAYTVNNHRKSILKKKGIKSIKALFENLKAFPMKK